MNREIELYELINYIANILWKQTGKGSCSPNNGLDYVPETEEDKKQLEKQTTTRTQHKIKFCH